MKLEHTKESYIITACLWLLLLSYSGFAQTPSLEGMWEMYNDKGEKLDKAAKVAQSGANLAINNGYGVNSTAVLTGNTIKTSDGLTGTISPDGMRITWNIGYVWLKQRSTANNLPQDTTNANAVDLNGTWAMFEGNGKPYDQKASITQNGISVTLNNGYGSQATVSLAGSKLSVRAWKLTGTVSADGKRIDWSNGFYWVKKDLWDRLEVTRIEERSTPKNNNVAPTPTANNPADNRTLTLRNNGAVNVTINLYKANRRKFDNTPVKSIKWVDGGSSPSVNFGADIQPGTGLDVEITMKVGGLGSTWDILIYQASIPANATNLCFEVGGTAYKPSANPCNKTQAVEYDYVTLKNEAGFMANMKLDYVAETSGTSTGYRTITTDDTLLGFERKIYIPRDAVSDKMTLKVNGIGVIPNVLLSKTLQTNAKISDCYKVWGDAAFPKISPCSLSSTARKIKFWNNSGIIAFMDVTYGGNQKVTTNRINVTQTETLEIPTSESKAAIMLKFFKGDFDPPQEISTITIPYNFTGELCYKVEGATNSPLISTCDNVVGDTFGASRQLRFQNEAGYDAQLIVSYFVDEKINGVARPMPKILTTGMVNGLGGKFRLVSIPKNTSKGMPVTISIQGNATVKNDIWSTTLPADFTDSPQPCFKVWGTLFDPKGGTCSQ